MEGGAEGKLAEKEELGKEALRGKEEGESVGFGGERGGGGQVTWVGGDQIGGLLVGGKRGSL